MKLAAVGAVLAACSSPVIPPQPASGTLSPIASSEQLITAIVKDWSSTSATMRLWRRNGTSWIPVGGAWPAVVGHGGTAWGAGSHGIGAPTGRDGPRKVEGDGKSPAGAFSLVASYGYAANPPSGAQLPYQQTTEHWKCVDDPTSREYNRIFDVQITPKDWSSAEEMKRTDILYTWVVEVAHNAARTPNHGSCIFLHVWSGESSTTSGCTAMPEATVANLVTMLDPIKAPVLVLLPYAEYEALSIAWGLPIPAALER